VSPVEIISIGRRSLHPKLLDVSRNLPNVFVPPDFVTICTMPRWHVHTAAQSPPFSPALP